MNLFYELISDEAGKKIKFEREAWGMDKQKLAELAFTDIETIESIENGYVCMMDFNMLNNISKALQVSPFIFFNKKLSEDRIIELLLENW